MASGTARRVRIHRDSLRAAGLRPLQIWIPDVRKPGFAEECRRQSLLLRDDPQEREALEWMESVADTKGWQ